MPQPSGVRSFRVWDPAVRSLHWALVASVVAAWVTRKGYGSVHEIIGYAALVIVVLRSMWGLFGGRYARFSQFVYPLSHTVDYARTVRNGTARRYIGHNPLGGWMAVGLLCLVLAVTLSGWLYTTDRFWGVEWVENLHDALTWILIALVALHITGVAFTSIRDRENLVLSMLDGRKAPPQDDDVA